MTLQDLLKDIYPAYLSRPWAERPILLITCDSRQAQENSLFVALSGTTHDGRDFIDEALKKGASVVVTDHKAPPLADSLKGRILRVDDPRDFLKKILIRFYGDPSQRVKTIGITGTNGKTTITYLLESIMTQAGFRCAVIGTINTRLGEKILSSKNTTPGLVENCALLKDFQKSGAQYCAMEVSSHALSQGRVDLIDFRAGVFTNLTGDHLDYHRDMEDYFAAKSKLFLGLSRLAVAVLNGDDPFGRKLMNMTEARRMTYGLSRSVDVTAVDIDHQLSHSSFTLKTYEGSLSIVTKLIGQHNIYNILAAAAVCLSQGIGLKEIKKGIEYVPSVPGRLESICCGQDFHVFVDYAHTEDALRNVLGSLRKISPARIILVFGCGGNRDPSKRPKMGVVACDLADWSIMTSDNPRNEDPQSIVDQILSGCSKDNYEVILNREEAIRRALALAEKGDVVVLAGKGHEDYQIFKDRTIHFDDREVVRKYFAMASNQTPIE